ncbi:DNA repair protein RecN [Idiomarina tyrosinivorans]|uniref:DNA repair protein RecN n=1 Tax=Idiomarina tyrosinivorans TaxID=1445662 RepID=A0A432ZR88_9GAMM|nr:DNA repair protein RecN [Idiomarina tyrosinivorans]RUO80417.1 DNA repair protein RecN [Idiomarina tyrosinivorans]
MLTHLHIRNFAVVKAVDIDFNNGMTAVTGETGAGKSIALDALSLCLGTRADAGWVRPGADKSEIIASFAIANESPAMQWLQQQELDDEQECVLRRVVTAEGRSRAWINGTPVPASQLKQLAPMLVHIHGQHEHQALTQEENQLQLLDRYARHPDLLAAVADAYQNWAGIEKEYRKLNQQQSERDALRQLLDYQVEELEQFNLGEGEFEALEEQHKKLANSKTLLEDTLFASNALYDGEHNNAFSLIQQAIKRLNEAAELDPQLNNTVKLLNDAGVSVEEAARELVQYQESLELEPAELETVEQRMTQALALAKKHQVAPQKLVEKHQALAAELDGLANESERLAQLMAQRDSAKQQYREAAKRLSQSRRKAADELSQKIVASMHQLNMTQARFDIQVQHHADATATKRGTDNVEMQVSTNPGQPLQALAKVASGGELSRISLAIQVITSTQETTPTMMFDEVDVGVSGPTAAIVGKLLRQLGETNQVICVTHLPQVAAKAHNQLQVAKSTDGNETLTQVTALNRDDRVIELARLLGGDSITDKTKANAEELLAS